MPDDHYRDSRRCPIRVRDSFSISQIDILPVRPQAGLIGFASFVIDDRFFVGNVGIHTRLGGDGGYRLVYPTKVLPTAKRLSCFNPITRDAGDHIERAIADRLEQLSMRSREQSDG